MTYDIDIDKLYDLIDEETSRVAAQSATQDGQPLYDVTHILTMDKDTIGRYLKDALDSLLQRTFNVATFLPAEEDTDEEGETISLPPRIYFNVEDFDDSMTAATHQEITRYITLAVCSLWFTEKGLRESEVYAQRGKAALDKAIQLIYSRKKPERWKSRLM